MNEFGKEVKKVCVDLDITQHSIAESLGMSDNGLSNALNRSNVGLQQMRRIADVMNCDLEIKLKPKSPIASTINHSSDKLTIASADKIKEDKFF